MQKVEDSKVEELTETIKAYVNTRYELIRLQLVDSTCGFLATLITFFLLLLAGLFFLFFFSYAIAGYLNEITTSRYAGFFIVGGFYLLLGSIVFLIREGGIRVPLMNRFIRHFLKEF